jgi:hypothetical protein
MRTDSLRKPHSAQGELIDLVHFSSERPTSKVDLAGEFPLATSGVARKVARATPATTGPFAVSTQSYR